MAVADHEKDCAVVQFVVEFVARRPGLYEVKQRTGRKGYAHHQPVHAYPAPLHAISAGPANQNVGSCQAEKRAQKMGRHVKRIAAQQGHYNVWIHNILCTPGSKTRGAGTNEDRPSTLSS